MQTNTKTGVLLHPSFHRWMLTVHRFSVFVSRFFWSLASGRTRITEIVRQGYAVGILSLPLITLTGTITGIVFTQQSRPSLEAFGATSWLPSLVTLAMVRSLAPLVTALVCAGKVGSSIGAEIGSMKVTEQLEAMEVSGIDPYGYLVVSRTLATTVMVPFLTLYFALMGFLGAYVNVATNEGTSWASFVDTAFGSLGWLDLWTALFRALAFGFSIGIIACYAGFQTTRGTEGVGQAANSAVVNAMLAVFLEEVLIVQVVGLLRGVFG